MGYEQCVPHRTCPSSYSKVCLSTGTDVLHSASHSRGVLSFPWIALSSPEWLLTHHFSLFQPYSSEGKLIIIILRLDHSTNEIQLLDLLVSTRPSLWAPLLPDSLAHSSKLGCTSFQSLELFLLLPTIDNPFCNWMSTSLQPTPACKDSCLPLKPHSYDAHPWCLAEFSHRTWSLPCLIPFASFLYFY